MATFKENSFQPGHIVFTVGELADKLYFVKQGKLQILDESGGLISTISKGQSFGEQAFLIGGIRGATVKAVDEAICIEISSEDANSLLGATSNLLIPIFEALLLQQNMTNELAKCRKTNIDDAPD